jgi:hypothetical protein
MVELRFAKRISRNQPPGGFSRTKQSCARAITEPWQRRGVDIEHVSNYAGIQSARRQGLLRVSAVRRAKQARC